MADTVDLNEITEYFDDEEVLADKCRELAGLIAQARKGYFFTGAGLSTSAGISDYRGPNGVWTRRAQGRSAPRGVRITQATPTYAHMAVAALVETGEMRGVVSQNVDGLHRRSGVARADIAELHGNCYLEVCWKCEMEHLRTFDVSERINGSGRCKECAKRVPHFCHCTSRKCGRRGCGAVLKDSIIHFGENLPEGDLEKAFAWGRKADLCVVLGSSLRVTPAADVPAETAGRGGDLVIVNLQKTPLDDEASLIIRGRIDDVMTRVMAELGRSDEVLPFYESPAAVAEAARMGVPPPPAAVARMDGAAAAPSCPDTLFVGNTARASKKSRNTKWTVYVRPAVADAPDGTAVDDIIETVEFGLHSTFSPSQIEVSQAPYEITRVGWGTFDVKIRVRFRPETGRAPLALVHPLSFSAGGSQADVALE